MSNEIVQHNNIQTMMLDHNTVESCKEVAKLMAQSKLSIPDHLRGNPADCLAIVFQAAQWRMSPFAVAQKTFFIQGSIGYEAQLVNAAVSSSNAIKGRFHYEYKGTREEWMPSMKKVNKNGKDSWVPVFNPNACIRVGAQIRGESSVTWGNWIYPADQKVFNSPLWRTNPQQQAGYLAVKFWARMYTPDILLGVYTPDEVTLEREIRDVNPDEREKTARSSVMDKLSKMNPKPNQEPELYDGMDDSNIIQPELTQEQSKHNEVSK